MGGGKRPGRLLAVAGERRRKGGLVIVTFCLAGMHTHVHASRVIVPATLACPRQVRWLGVPSKADLSAHTACSGESKQR